MHGEDGPAARLAAFGDQLIEVHNWLRGELARLDDDLDAYLDGGQPPTPDLRAHCLSFCAAIERHHTGEDDGAFPALADRHPELAPVLGKLREDHQMVSSLLRRLRELIGDSQQRIVADPSHASRVRGELDGLRAIMESHFRYEERTIGKALNDLTTPGWMDEPPAFLRTDPVPR